MMNKMQQSVCALAVLAATTLPAMAASTVDVRVIGTITPAACTPTLSGGGTIDYGAINPTTLSATDYTVLPEREVSLAITCDAPAKVAITPVNGRPGTVAGATESGGGAALTPVPLLSLTGAGVVGLGLSNGQKVGGYAMKVEDLTTDGAPADVIRTALGSSTGWQADGNHYGFFRNVGTVPFQVTAAAPGTLVPEAFTTLAGKLRVQAYLNKTSELDVSSPVALDGLTTIEMVYL
ncbi:DUF1120 domain-containing protein [Serratia rubidaea]|uniref:DUF1120 domain-containing protein n=1 Tax=Serratia rubidaea TaxID=61652 RepID=UPI002349B07E|nr:DUF1120 domain-containing protein [Serratia rubidaea]MDC6117473.1 DUF1120 domain-containing protein [Serratia rubidaea]